ncbi:MAG: hypothetical protein U0166_00285 [Acidobacteriota bacterium]
MKLGDQTLDEWFIAETARKKGDLRERGPQYKAQYENAATQLNRYVHPEVTKGAIAADGGFLTDHGPDHIRKVICRAGDLLRDTECALSLYETYLVLMAIHLHDVGNAFGRAGHETVAQRAMDWLGSAAGRDTIEKKLILQLARAHGGTVSGSKDTIASLEQQTSLMGCLARPRLLAALVRLADELADDRERSSEFMIDTNTLPAEAEVFHQYANALHSVYIDREASAVRLEYSLEVAVALRTYQFRSSEWFLLDYILLRALKLHTERLYCMRFLRPYGVALESVVGQIKVFGKPIEPLETIGFRLSEAGYPTEPLAGIYDLCPELASKQEWAGIKVTGPALAERLGDADVTR